MSKVFGYIRVSTALQELSEDAQEAKIRRAAELYRQTTDIELFAEPDTCGAIAFLERPQAKALLARIKASGAGPVTLIIPKVDRLGRDTGDICITSTMLQNMGVDLIFLDINVDTRTPIGRAVMQFTAIFAELELARIRERITDVLDYKRSQGELTGTVPYGWDAVETGRTSSKGVVIRTLVDNQVEQSWILHMHTLRLNGWGYHSIANDLNGRNVATKRGAGEIMKLRNRNGAAPDKKFTTGKWQAGNVSKVLNNKTVQAWLEARALPQAA